MTAAARKPKKAAPPLPGSSPWAMGEHAARQARRERRSNRAPALDVGGIQLRSGVPLPPPGKAPCMFDRLVVLLASMQPGQSFEAPKSAKSALYRAVTLANKGGERRYETRRLPGELIGVWRTK